MVHLETSGLVANHGPLTVLNGIDLSVEKDERIT